MVVDLRGRESGDKIPEKEINKRSNLGGAL